MYIQPFPGYLVVEPVESETKTTTGIILPSEFKDKESQSGKVLSIGSTTSIDGQIYTFPLKVGDVVIYKEWGGKEFKTDGKKVLILKFDDVIAVINSKNK